MIDPVWAYTLAAVTLLLVTVILHVLAKSAFDTDPADKRRGLADPADKRRGLLALLVGADNRVSTSKLQVLMWTYAIAFVLLAIVWEGRADDVLKHGLETQYLFLLGIPVVGAAGSSLITTSKLQAGKADKPTDPSKKAETVAQGIGKGLKDVVTDDTGHGDLGDFQYFLFNLVALTYFFVAFFAASADVLPTIPDTLVALTGASAFAYLSKKGVATNEPKLTGVYPSTAKVDKEITIRGVNLLGPSSESAPNDDPSRGLKVLIGGVLGTGVSVDDKGIVTGTVPAVAPTGSTEIGVVTAAGVQTNTLPFNVVKPDA
jgi:hypothetical protein